MNISYRIKPRDVFALSLYHNTHNVSFWVMLIVPLMVCSYLFGQAAVEDNTRSLAVQILLVTIINLLLIGILLSFLLFMVALSLVSRKNKTVFTEYELTLGEDSFVEASEYERKETKWRAVHRLVRTKRHLMLYTSKTTGTLVPRRAFRYKGAWDAFYDYCDERIAASKSA